ncbi:MAG: DUF5784 family protein [Halobacteriaceae archaeon]
MARPLRFRYSPHAWHERTVREALYDDLDANLGATMRDPWYRAPEGYDAVRFEMDNGDVALFCYRPGTAGDDPDDGGETAEGTPVAPEGGAFWIGNTETPSALWRTEKFALAAVPDAVADWAERELLAQLYEEAPWLEAYPTLAAFFLPVLLSKDGRETTREYFREHAAGFPDADREPALRFYEELIERGVFDGEREVMAAKLGTSPQLDRTRMDATMAEFTVARLLDDAGHAVTPEVEVTTGHSIDYRAGDGEGATLVEVTRPLPPERRSASTAPAALRDTAKNKASGQLAEHRGGVTLFVDCTGFSDEQWAAVAEATPEVPHRPAVVFRARPEGRVEGYRVGSVPLDLDGAVTWI